MGLQFNFLIDLPRLRAKLEKREYKMAKEFASDVCLMLENARAYHRKYNKDPQVLRCADLLENYFYENLSNIIDEMRGKAVRRVSCSFNKGVMNTRV